MKSELRDKLFKDYPKILDEKYLIYGFDVPDAWYNLLKGLFGNLQWNADNNNYPQTKVEQVKEKFGSLRMYYTYDEDYKSFSEEAAYKEGVIAGTVEAYTDFSRMICFNCGSAKNVKATSDGWIINLCEDCMKERNEKTEK
jgi:hypothetical protein